MEQCGVHVTYVVLELDRDRRPSFNRMSCGRLLDFEALSESAGGERSEDKERLHGEKC